MSLTQVPRLRAGFASPSINVAILWVTKEGKIFDKNGLDVEPLYLESTLAQKALIAGNIDFAMMTAITCRRRNLPALISSCSPASSTSSPTGWWHGPRSMRPSSRKGKRIGIFRFGWAADRASRLVLAKFGLDPEGT